MGIDSESLGDFEIEKRLSVPKIKREIFEAAGKRTPEQIKELISRVESILDFERQRGQGKLKDTIEQIKAGPDRNNYFVDQNVIYLPEKGSAVFIGDLHGDAEAVISIIEQTRFIENMEEEEKNMRLIFLGDYADRGAKDVETLEMVLALKARYPDNVILLRGNHEEKAIAQSYGLFDSLIKRFSSEGANLFERYNLLFEKLPTACIIGNGIFAVHGGIPNQEISSLGDLNKPEFLFGLRWNDPSEDILDYAPNGKRGGGTWFFGQRVFERFMDKIGAKVMVRGHEYPKEGAETHFNGRLLTIFSNGGEKSVSSGYKNSTKARFLWIGLDKPLEKFTPSMADEVDYRFVFRAAKEPEKANSQKKEFF